jgi:hypothetical protein
LTDLDYSLKKTVITDIKQIPPYWRRCIVYNLTKNDELNDKVCIKIAKEIIDKKKKIEDLEYADSLQSRLF